MSILKLPWKFKKNTFNCADKFNEKSIDVKLVMSTLKKMKTLSCWGMFIINLNFISPKLFGVIVHISENLGLGSLRIFILSKILFLAFMVLLIHLK